MFWAFCSLRYFGFLCTSESTVPGLTSFSLSLHLGVQNIAVDSPSAPSCMCLQIKGLKTDLLGKAPLSTLVLAGPHSMQPTLCWHISWAGATFQVPCSCSRMSSPFSALCPRTVFSRSGPLQTFQVTSSATASTLGLPLWWQATEFLIT